MLVRLVFEHGRRPAEAVQAMGVSVPPANGVAAIGKQAAPVSSTVVPGPGAIHELRGVTK